MNSNAAKLLYVLPEYHRASFTNAHSLIVTIAAIADKMKLALFIEHGEAPINLQQAQSVQVGKMTMLPIRLWERFHAFRHFRQNGGEWIYVHGSYASALLGKWAMGRKGKVAYWHCEKFEDYGKDLPPGRWGYFQWKLFSDLPLRWTLRMVDLLVTGTPTVAQRYHELFHVPLRKIRILPNGIMLSHFHPSRRQKRHSHKVLFVHWLSPRKGVYELLDIFATVHAKMPEVHFMVVGDGPLKAWLFQAVKAKGLEEFVVVEGKVPHIKLKSYFEKADVFIMPSRQEGFPRVLLESMAWGLPFVTTEVGGVKDFLHPLQKKYMVPPKDPHAFAYKLLDLLKQPTMQKELRKVGLRHVRHYTVEKAADQFVALFSHE